MYKTKRNYENIQRMRFDGVGRFDIPQIQSTVFEQAEFVGFNYARSIKNIDDKALHFFIDDYQFNRVWTLPDRYIEMFKKFKYVLSPDFSLYVDFPMVLQIYNHYRKHWLGAYWQLHGIDVIPTIGWSDESSFEWCFDGEPVHGVVAVSSVGTQKSRESKQMFLDGYREMVKRLEPTQIIFYGNIPSECKGNIVHITQFAEKFKKAEVAQWE